MKKRNGLWISYISTKMHSVCPSIEVGIDVTDKSPFFIRPHHVKEEDKKILDKEIKRLCYLGI